MRAWLLVGGRLTVTPELARLAAHPPDLVVAADGGIRHARALGVTPDLWVGDFDSSDPDDALHAYVPREAVPRAKDFTDAELALTRARALGATDVTVVGAFGGRLDHTLVLALLAVRATREGTVTRLHSGRRERRGTPARPPPASAGGTGRHPQRDRPDGPRGPHPARRPLAPHARGRARRVRLDRQQRGRRARRHRRADRRGGARHAALDALTQPGARPPRT